MIKEEIINLIDGFIDDFEQKNIMRYEIAKAIYSALKSAGCLKEVSKDPEPIDAVDEITLLNRKIDYIAANAVRDDGIALDQTNEWTLSKWLNPEPTEHSKLEEEDIIYCNKCGVVLHNMTGKLIPVPHNYSGLSCDGIFLRSKPQSPDPLDQLENYISTLYPEIVETDEADTIRRTCSAILSKITSLKKGE